MIIEPKVRGFICTTAHPAGCAENVAQQIQYVEQQAKLRPINNVLIIGSSTGYGLASRIVASIACGANTLGIMFEKPATEKRPASAGWYNTQAFERLAKRGSHYAHTINGNAFSDEVKQEVIEIIKRDMPDDIDLVIYSLAAPRRTDPKTGTTHQSCLKTIGEPYTEKNVNVMTGDVAPITIASATQEEIDSTVKVMGGEDWQLWIEQLLAANVLNQGCKTVAYSYIGPELTYPIYRNGTIGQAKHHLEQTAKIVQQQLDSIQGQALISVNKAVVTQASAAIPVVPLYAAILYKVMTEAGTHEGCIEQMYRLFHDYLCTEQPAPLDGQGFIRLDDLELAENIQQKVSTIWQQIDAENVNQLADLATYRNEFYRLFGFEVEGVNYQERLNLTDSN